MKERRKERSRERRRRKKEARTTETRVPYIEAVTSPIPRRGSASRVLQLKVRRRFSGPKLCKSQFHSRFPDDAVSRRPHPPPPPPPHPTHPEKTLMPAGNEE